MIIFMAVNYLAGEALDLAVNNQEQEETEQYATTDRQEKSLTQIDTQYATE